ncbi:MAG TPA: ABC transporter permease [Anaerolineae bacterium]|nr:ABC transporter permease [Anaerolineae bacterium]HOQ98639.1 ABC transporter permease [Anaerolineae bacterium]HPL28253.1 ABC transporter permease [Anaerolineae bacterium]
MSLQQLGRAWHITAKDIRTYYLKPPLISWGMLLPAVFILAFYLRAPGDIRSAAPGLIGLTVLFGATSVEAVVISFEKRIGGMERLLMAPVSVPALLAGKVASGMLFGVATGALVWLGSTLAWSLPLAAGLPLVAIALGSATFALLGVLISLVMREVFDAMTLSNLFRFPMMFLSGVFVPVAALPSALQVVAALLPLTYTVDALRHLLLGGAGASYPLWTDLLASLAFAAALYVAALELMRRRLEDLL